MSYVSTYNAFQVSGITKAEQHVLTAICTFADKNGLCWPSVETIANRCLSSVRTVQHHINGLVSKGLLQRTMRAGRSSLIKVTVPTPATSAPPPPQILHPEPAIEPIKTIPAAPTLPAAVSPPSLFSETPEQPKTAVEPLQAVDGTMSLPEVAQEPVEADPLAEVPATLLADLGEVRKSKKRPAKPTKTEAAMWWTEARKCGWDMQTVITTMILHGWARFEASWVQHVPQAVIQGPQAVYKPEPLPVATPAVVSAARAKLADLRAKIMADGARRREEMARLRQ